MGLSPSNSSYVSPRDLEVAMHIESNSSYHPSPSSRVSSPSFEKIDINNSTTSQRSSRSYTKPSKRSRSNTPTNMYNNEMRDQEAREAGVSSRQRRKSNVNSGSAADMSIPTRRSEARDRSPRREKGISSSQTKSSNKQYGGSLSVKNENKGDEIA